jgi:hypothetical protein
VFAAHAADTIATLESVVRFTSVECDEVVWDAVIKDSTLAQHTMAVISQLTAVAVLLARQAGPGSAELQHCHSFLASLQKLGACPAIAANPSAMTLGLSCCFAAAEAAAALLPYPALQRDNDREQQLSSASDATGSAVMSCSSLPNLVIIGRCFLHFMQQTHIVNNLATEAQQFLVRVVWDRQMSDDSESVCYTMFSLQSATQVWLHAHSTLLAAAGYPAQTLLQQLQKLQDAIEAVHMVLDSPAALSGSSAEQSHLQSSSSSSSASKTSSPDLADAVSVRLDQQKQAGLALCCLAVSCLCNKPGCSNTSGPTELSLVTGRSCRCGGCRVAHYCSQACQARHWKQHKPVCTALAAAAAAAAGGTPAAP